MFMNLIVNILKINLRILYQILENILLKKII